MPPLISVFHAKEGKSLLSFIFLVSQYQKIMLKQFGVRKNFGYRKKILHRGISRFSVEKILSHSTEKLRRRTLLCFKKNLVSINFIHERGRHQGLVENFLFHRAEKLRKRSLVCFRNFLVWKKIMDKRWGGGYHFFR